MAISQLVEFLKETIKTAETYKELEYDIFNKYTFRPIFKSIPRDIHGRFVRNVSDPSMNIKDKVKELATFLESERSHALEGLKDLGDDTSKEKKSYDSLKGNDGKKVHYADGDDSDNDGGCKYCNGKSCKQEWDGLGCLDMYKLSDADARIKSWKKRNICFKCGVKRNQDHKCGWRNKGKINTQCNVDGCRYGAAMCGKHKQNFSNELKR